MRDKAVIFDLGGVFLALDYRRTKQAFIDLGSTNFTDYFAQANQKGLIQEFEIGKVTAANFRDGIRQTFGLKDVEDHEVDKAWNAMLIHLMPERLAALPGLKERYRVFLFSNINEIHEQGVKSLWPDLERYEEFVSKFDGVYYSHIVGFRKPHRESFERIIAKNSLVPHKTLFIDDMKENLIDAKEAGLHVHHLQPSDCLVRVIETHGFAL